MRRLLSLVVAMVLVLGTVSAFAVSADWSGRYDVKFRTQSTKVGSADKAYNTYMWQKLELYPSFTLSDNVKVSAGFFHQQFWGVGRFIGTDTNKVIELDDGAYGGKGDNDPMNQAVNTANTTLGVSAAWASLSFMEGKLGIDIGRRRNAEWGTGAFFGGPFTPDRIFVTYKTPGLGGLMLPYVIYEKRMTNSTTDGAFNSHQFLAGLIYVAPGKTVAGLTVTWLPTGKTFPRNNSGVNMANGALWAADIYVDHKVKTGFGFVKPTVEIVWAGGKTADKKHHSLALANGGLGFVEADIYADVLNFLVKAEINLDKMLTVIPEIAFQVAPKKGSADKRYLNFWGVNEYAGNLYTVGNIFQGFTGGMSLFQFDDMANTMYVKLDIQLDLLNEVVKGLGANVFFIYGMPLGKSQGFNATFSAGEKIEKSDKNTVMEFGLGVNYAIDRTTTVGLDFSYAKTGEGVDPSITFFVPSHGLDQDATYLYFGMDLNIKF